MSPVITRFLFALLRLAIQPLLFLGDVASNVYYWWYQDQYITIGGKQAVVISGCDTGFGNLAAKLFATRGVAVFAGCLSPQGVAELRAVKGIRPFIYDITDEASTADAKATVMKECSRDGLVLHALICNAGVAPIPGSVDWMRMDDYEKTLAVNLTGHIRSVLAFVQPIKQSRGRILVTASMAAYLSFPATSAYCASKFGIKGFAESIRCDLARFGVHVAVLAPELYPTAILGSWDAVDKRWSELPLEVKEDHPYERVEKSHKRYEQYLAFSRGNDPQEVAEAYYHAAFARVPRMTYILGAKAPLYELIAGLHDFSRHFLFSQSGQ